MNETVIPFNMRDRQRHDGADELSKLSGLSRDDVKSIWEEVKANHAKLSACERHNFTPQLVGLGKRVTCNRCNGSMTLTNVGEYIRGYVASGNSSDDIWPGWSAGDALEGLR